MAGREEELLEKQQIFSLKNIFTIFVPVTLALLILIFDFLRFWKHPLFDDIVLLAFFVGALPFATVQYLEFQRIKKLESEFPNLLADISSSVESGMSIPQAIYVSKERIYGALTPEIEKMSNLISWGVPFENVLLQLTKRAKSAYIQKLVFLIVEANRSGGDIRGILRSAARNARELKNIERDINMMIKPYVIISYITFFIFLVVILILYQTFILPLSKVGSTPFTESFDPTAYTDLFFHMLMFQGLFIGLTAGKMTDKKVIAGLRHSIILIVGGYFIYNSVVGWPIG